MTTKDNPFGICKYYNICQTHDCSFKCYPFTFLHGVDGKTGIWRTRNVPKKYDDCFRHNLPMIEPELTRQKMLDFMDRSVELVGKGIGLYLFSVPTPENPLGTGTGKTTTAASIINEFVINRSIEHLTGEREITTNPALFMDMAEFQNIYNSQFRGTKENQDKASEIFYRYKDRMKKVELLVIDDIAIRNSTESFTNELYEIINSRVNQDQSIIYTSNVALKDLVDIFGERIVSRIEGSTFQYPFTGKDHRRKEW